MKKVFALMLLVSVMFVFAAPSWSALPDNDIIILYTNDVHCGVDENLGYAGFVYCADEARKVTPYVTLVDAGDWAQGGAIGAISQGRYIVEIMNVISYDIAVPGNHEFGYGWGMFKNYARNLKCGFIACNLRDLRTGQLILKPYKIMTYGRVKVAFVGICTPETIMKSIPSVFMDDSGEYIYDFDGDSTGEKLIASVQNAVDAARAEGADYVIAVAHLGEHRGITEKWSAINVARNTKGINVFIDGHSHEVTPSLHVRNAESRDVIITQSGTKLNNVGKVIITKEGKITSELLNGFDGRNEITAAIINDIKARYEETINTHLTYTSFDLRAMDDKGDWLVRNGENNLCNIIADAILASARETKTMKADIALVNGGDICANLTSGEITYKDALNVLPFSSTVCIYEVSGQTILDELEMGSCLLPKDSGGFLHTAGLTYMVNAAIPTPVKVDERNKMIGIEGERRVRNVRINGKVIDPEKMYKVASSNYVLREGGDGHVFAGAKLIEPDYMTVTDAFAHYLRDFKVLPERYGKSQGRIRIAVK